MDRKIITIHKDLEPRWRGMNLDEQMGNIGSEVSRTISWSKHNPDNAKNCAERALELFDFTIDAHANEPGTLKEVCRAREVFCDFFYGENVYNSSPQNIMKYFDQFAIRARLMA